MGLGNEKTNEFTATSGFAPMKSPSAPVPAGLVVETMKLGLSLAPDEVPVPAALVIAWQANEDFVSRDADDLLRGEEIARFHRITHVGVRRDFLLGRMAAKTALSACLPDIPAKAWEIRRGCWHQPVVRGPVGGLAVTLAHQEGVAVALAHDDRAMAGIDVEPFDREMAAAVASQVSASEAAWARTMSGAPGWHLLWTAREALGKLMRSGLLRPQVLAATQDWKRCPAGWTATFEQDDLIAARSVVSRGYVVTWVLPRGSLAASAEDELAGWVQAALDRVS